MINRLPVQVTARQAAAVASISYAVGVEHGYDLEHKAAAQRPCSRVVRGEEVNDTLTGWGGGKGAVAGEAEGEG